MNKLDKLTDLESKLKDNNIIITIFTVTWCSDCHYIEPFIDDLINKYSADITVYNIDIDELPQIKKMYKINGIPSFVAFKNGIEINRFVSRSRKTKIEIVNFFEETLQKSK